MFLIDGAVAERLELLLTEILHKLRLCGYLISRATVVPALVNDAFIFLCCNLQLADIVSCMYTCEKINESTSEQKTNLAREKGWWLRCSL